MNIEWIKCKGDIWCELSKLDLNHDLLDVNGVYILFTEETNNGLIYVGYGNVKKELNRLVKDTAIAAFLSHRCYVTWAKVNVLSQVGIVNYLISRYRPKLNPKPPKGIPISVKLPWEL